MTEHTQGKEGQNPTSAQTEFKTGEGSAVPTAKPEPKKKTVVVIAPCIIDGKNAAIGESHDLDESVANILLGEGVAQTPEDAAKAKEANDAAAKKPEASKTDPHKK